MYQRQHLYTVFTGTREEIRAKGGWESLQSFYQTSSYGKSQFEAWVCPNWCVYNQNCDSLGGGPGAARYATSWYKTEYAKTNHGALGADAHPITWFDSNQDGYIDLIWLVYSHETGQSGGDWWAYVTYMQGSSASVSSPNPMTLGWAGIQWLDAACNGYDSHTFIHETGHTYGLDDYYDYNHTWAPMGGVDFMDHNLGDHNMVSKFTLGWTSPYVVEDEAIITLRPGTTTGDCFIIPSPGYNGTAFDEYLMFELMAPVGLCETDYKAGYEGTAGYSKPGIRVMHADMRVYSGNRDTYAKTISDVSRAKAIRIDNSYAGRNGLKSDSDYFPTFDNEGKEVQNYMTELSLIEANCNPDTNWTKSSTYNASNASLFHAGDVFNLSNKQGYAKTFMPSRTNLWNKAKTITSWVNDKKQNYTIDETCTFNYILKFLGISTPFGQGIQ